MGGFRRRAGHFVPHRRTNQPATMFKFDDLMLTLRVVVALTVSFAAVSGCEAQITKMTSNNVDWSTLEFKCARQDDLLPKPDPEADEWYRQANTLFKAGVKADSNDMLVRSFNRMKQAAERGHIKAMSNLALNYLNGDGVKQSDQMAVHWAEELIKRNSGLGYYHMAYFLEQGIGVRQDRVAALTYYRKAADLGDPQAQVYVGKKIAASVGQSAQEEKARGFDIARSMFECALAQNLPEAGYALGNHLAWSEGVLPKALIAYQSAARLGHDTSLWRLHMIFEEGEGPIEKDSARSSCYELLWKQSKADKTKTFPGIDKICPLPPKPMPKG